MNNNVYRFGEDIRLQEQGMRIGVKMTGDVAKGVMTRWDKRFLEKLATVMTRPVMYGRYIDDQNVLIEILQKGEKFDPDEGEIVRGDPANDNMSDEERTFTAVREIGNSISDMIQLTVDYPSNNSNGRVPILDLECWVIRDENGFQKILYSFYEKPMKSSFVMMRASAVSDSTKRSALTQEAVRRFRNTHEDVPKEEVAEIFNKFSVKMKNSGYTAKFRGEVIRAGDLAFKEQKRLDSRGEKVMFRSRNFNKTARKRAKANNRDWWRKSRAGRDPPITFIKVHWTPGSRLLKAYQEVCKKKWVGDQIRGAVRIQPKEPTGEREPVR